MPYLYYLAALAAAALLRRPAVHLARLALADRAARRHWPAMIWHSWRYRHTMHLAGLAYLDPHRRRDGLALPGRRSVPVEAAAVGRIRYPRGRFRLTPFGWEVRARPVAKVTRTEIAKAAPWLAASWGCHRVLVSAPNPRRVVLRAMREDPLSVPFGLDACPAGTFGNVFPRRLLLGRDDAGDWRYLPIAGVTGVTITGLPGAGKTSLVLSLVGQLAGTRLVRLVVLDGKDAGDWDDYRDRATVLGDDPELAEEALSGEVDLMRDRRAQVVTATGGRNGWHGGPAESMPLSVIILDECQQFLDINAARSAGGKAAEETARRNVAHTGTLIRRGRSVLTLVILVTQQGTTDSFGTSQVRNNCALSVAFALRTMDGCVAALGDDIRAYPDLAPVTLQGPESVGVCVANIRTGLDAFTRLRVPEVTEAAAAARAAETAHLAGPPLALVPEPEEMPA